MNKKIISNLYIVTPVILWGFALNSLNFRLLRQQISSEMQIGVITAFITLNVIYLLYYLLLKKHLKCKEEHNSMDRIFIDVCMVVGTLFTLFTFI